MTDNYLFSLTDVERRHVRRCMEVVLQETLAGLVELEEGTITKEEVIETVLDADRLEGVYSTPPEQLAIKKFRQLSIEQQEQFARTVFTFDQYGLYRHYVSYKK